VDGCRLRAVNAKERRHRRESHEVKTTMRFTQRADEDLRNATRSLDGVSNQLSRLATAMSSRQLEDVISEDYLSKTHVTRDTDASLDVLSDVPVTLDLRPRDRSRQANPPRE
jgi:hypothetical protein